MHKRWLFLACFFAALPSLAADWSLTRTPEFEIYAQAGEAGAGRALTQFEQLHDFFITAGVDISGPPVRVIAFRSRTEYSAYRLRSSADAYYVGSGNQDYIVMADLGTNDFGVAAHEYVHLVLHHSGIELPAWLGEGLAEFFSTVQINKSACVLGALHLAHVQLLNSHVWLPVSALLRISTEAAQRKSRPDASLFYAESWAVTYVLVTSPQYRGSFSAFVQKLLEGATSEQALAAVYQRTAKDVEQDARALIGSGSFRQFDAPTVRHRVSEAVSVPLSYADSELMLGQLTLAIGDTARAQSIFESISKEAPRNGAAEAALGSLALQRGDRDRAAEYWRRALRNGVADADLYFQYAQVLEDSRAPVAEIRSALEKAIQLRPTFDDARFKLGLLESGAGNFEIAVAQLRAIRHVLPGRAFAYWLALGNALSETGDRGGAKAAAAKAAEHSITAEQRGEAARLRYVADTDLTVQFVRGGDGQPQLAMTRKPHGATGWNPFIEPGDHMQRADGQLQEVVCKGNTATGMRVLSNDVQLDLSLPDPGRVLITGGTAEFTCGVQQPRPVTVEYAETGTSLHLASGILRGLELH